MNVPIEESSSQSYNYGPKQNWLCQTFSSGQLILFHCGYSQTKCLEV